MWKLTIEDDEGKQTGLPLAHEEYALGRGESNSIRLTDRNVSRRHATLAKNGQGWAIRDLDSYNGTYVNGVRVHGEQHLRHGDLVQLGDYRIEIVDEALSSAVTSPTPPPGSRSTAHLPLHTRPNRLVMVVGPTPGAEFPLDGERFTIGRSEDATISINHSSVSRLHAELISLGNGRYEVVDKQSANGVRINGVELKRGLLEAGDAIELGDVRLRFVGAGKIFRAGPDGAPGLGAAPGAYGGAASSQRTSSGGLGGASKVMGILLAVVVLVAIVVLVVTRVRSRGAAAQPEAAPAATAASGDDARLLAAAHERFLAGDVDDAHRKLQQIAETAPLREAQEFKDIERAIEERWAEGMFQRVERAETDAEKLALLNEIAKTTSVPARLREKVAEMRREIDPDAPAEPPPAPHDGPPSFAAAQPAHPAQPAPAPAPPATSATAAASAARPAETGAVPVSAPLDSSSYPAQRRVLEPKVWGGKASTSEIRLLRAICIHQGDAVCRDRATALLEKRQP
ncbi:uncharacterized protein SOCEGT47_056530 [Sorangium cellulosum]|uniref:FHA domain-containing protein n=1 Tax=Sorangium cellulosum TaxID=56 RepID=A0A4P2Q6Q2_SORCE|nr:FHA domain-containing protein [Sorangium cellulosum]AUX25110.1 uncharacterized protein SOCEGT47_056530 [Sorangium cellulosum]